MSATFAIALAAFVVLFVATPVAAQSTPDRTKPPAPGPAPALKLPPIVKRTLANGLPVWIVEMHKVPLVSVTVVVKTGAGADPAGKTGLAAFTADLLDEGAGGKGALELADAVALLGATLTTGSDWDSSVVALQLPVAQVDAGLDLLGDVALRPTFAADELERLKKTRLTDILQGRDDPSTLANLAFSRAVYGRSHRYGAPLGGSAATLGALTLADVKTFYAQAYQPARAQLIVVGDVTAEAILPALERRFGGWNNTTPLTPVMLPAAPPATRTIYLVDKPGAAQSQLRIGLVGVARSTPDFFTLDVVNTILGGSFTSRLNQNLRETHGYAYGARSSFVMRTAPGPFVASAGVQTDKTTEALKECFVELDAIRGPMPADDLTRGRNYEALGFPAEFETLRGMAGQLTALAVFGLPDTFFADYVPRILAVTPAEAQAAAQKYIVPQQLAIVVVGDLSKIEAGIRAAKLAPVQVLTVDDLMK